MNKSKFTAAVSFRGSKILKTEISAPDSTIKVVKPMVNQMVKNRVLSRTATDDKGTVTLYIAISETRNRQTVEVKILKVENDA